MPNSPVPPLPFLEGTWREPNTQFSLCTPPFLLSILWSALSCHTKLGNAEIQQRFVQKVHLLSIHEIIANTHYGSHCPLFRSLRAFRFFSSSTSPNGSCIRGEESLLTMKGNTLSPAPSTVLLIITVGWMLNDIHSLVLAPVFHRSSFFPVDLTHQDPARLGHGCFLMCIIPQEVLPRHILSILNIPDEWFDKPTISRTWLPHFQKEKALDFGWSTLHFNNDFIMASILEEQLLPRPFFSTQQALETMPGGDACVMGRWSEGRGEHIWTVRNAEPSSAKLKPELRGFGGIPLLNHHLGWARDEKYWNTMREHIIKWQWHATQWTASNDFKVKLWKHHHISRHLEKQKHPFLRVSKGLTFWIWNSSFLLEFRDFKNWLQHMLTAAPVCWSRPRRGLQGQGRW